MGRVFQISGWRGVLFAKKYILIFFSLFTFFFFHSSALAFDFSAHDPQSQRKVDHGIWDRLLKEIVVPYTPAGAGGGLSEWDCRTTQSRIRTCRGGGFENKNLKGVNLIPYRYLNEDFGIRLNTYIVKMTNVDIEKLNKN